MVSHEEVVVVVTGFGPFRQFLINPSWQAAQNNPACCTGSEPPCKIKDTNTCLLPVQRLKMLGLGQDVVICAKELPVSYAAVREAVADIWETIDPKVAVHMGIAAGTTAVTLEQCGKNRSYKQRDVCGVCPPGYCCVDEGPDTLLSIIDMKTLRKHLKSAGLDVVYSRDAGRYLCDFAYYYSLYLSQGRAAFIHLPTSGSLAHLGRLVPVLQDIIQAILDQLDGPRAVAQHHRQGTQSHTVPTQRLRAPLSP